MEAGLAEKKPAGPEDRLDVGENGLWRLTSLGLPAQATDRAHAERQ